MRGAIIHPALVFYHRNIQEVTPHEFFKFFGILLIARIEGVPGGNLWKNDGRTEGYKKIPCLEKGVMKEYRFKQIKRLLPFAFEDEKKKEEGDPWWRIVKLIEDFNSNRKETVLQSNEKIGDECMSALRPRTTPTGKLPHLSHIARKPEDLGAELKAIADTCLHI